MRSARFICVTGSLGLAISAFAAVRHTYFYVATWLFFADAQPNDGSYWRAVSAATAHLLFPLWQASRRFLPYVGGFTFAIPPSTLPLHLSIHWLGPPFPHVLAVIPAPLADTLRWDFHRRRVSHLLVRHPPSQFFVGAQDARSLRPGCICGAAPVTRPCVMQPGTPVPTNKRRSFLIIYDLFTIYA